MTAARPRLCGPGRPSGRARRGQAYAVRAVRLAAPAAARHAAGVAAAMVDFSAAPADGSLDVTWIHGAPVAARCADPPIQVHRYDPHTVIMRQSKAVHYEAPFVFLLFGNDRALLLDTGATADPAGFPLRCTVDSLVSEWLAEHPRESYELVVAHTHGHGDHKAGDPQFADRPYTTVVPPDLDAVRTFFGFSAWPGPNVTFDLGGRVLEILSIPGHHEASIATYDPWTGWLLTGDTVLPGRLLVQDYPAFQASLDRLVAFTKQRRVSHVLGCHVEMTGRPGRDFPFGATYQPGEVPPQLTVSDLVAARDAAAEVAARRGVHRYDRFVVFYRPRRAAIAGYAARAL
jgi:hydroxyacylglutathione hydrolase